MAGEESLQNIVMRKQESEKTEDKKNEKPDALLTPKSVSFVDILSKFCCPGNRSFATMNPSERKDRVNFLWKRLRIVVRHRGLLQRIMAETLQRERDRYGIEPDFNQRIDPE